MQGRGGVGFWRPLSASKNIFGCRGVLRNIFFPPVCCVSVISDDLALALHIVIIVRWETLYLREQGPAEGGGEAIG